MPQYTVVINPMDSPQDMTGWSIEDKNAENVFNFPQGFILKAGAKVKIVANDSGENSKDTLYWKEDRVWDDVGDVATLYDAQEGSRENPINELDCNK